jgi:hypothetical protein
METLGSLFQMFESHEPIKGSGLRCPIGPQRKQISSDNPRAVPDSAHVRRNIKIEPIMGDDPERRRLPNFSTDLSEQADESVH